MNLRRCFLIGSLALAVAGCASTREPAPVANKDKLMWDYRKAATALRQGRLEEARTLLDEAVTELNAIRAADPAARRSRSYFRNESEKFFLGEPYERVMAFYYRGMIYWMEGQLDNARACYRSAQLLDADSEHKQYASDYVLLDYLDGFTTAKLKGDGTEAFKRAETHATLKPLPPYDTGANVIVFAEFGHGPVKYGAGEYGEQLRFAGGRAGAASARLTVNGQTLALRPYDDLFFQASTRGGRVMDHVLAGKAVFKSNTDAAGNAALIAGTGLVIAGSGSRSAADEVGVGLLAAGLLSKVFSSATTPTADTRMWANLPQYLSFGALTLPPGQHQGVADFFDAAGKEMPSLRKNVVFSVYPDRDTVIFVSELNQ